jgi:hypothetical protein
MPFGSSGLASGAFAQPEASMYLEKWLIIHTEVSGDENCIHVMNPETV